MRWWLVLLLAACGDNLAEEPANPQSGSRLKLYWFESDDGLRAPASLVFGERFYDVETGTDCEPIEWADGKTRCTPGVWHEYPGFPGTYNITVFLDADCTRLVGRGSNPTNVYLHGGWRGEQFYPDGVIVGAKFLNGQPHQYFAIEDGVCVGPIIDSMFALYDLGASIEPDRIPVLTRRVPDTLERIGQQVDEDEDGARIPRGLFDRTLDTYCGPDTVHGPTTVCAPYSAPVEDRYVDAMCTRPAVATTDPDIHAASSYSPFDWCSQYFALGSAVTGQTYQRVDGACVEASVPDGATVYQIGAPLELPPLDIAPVFEGHRLAAVSSSRIASRPTLGLYDTTLDARCDFFQDAVSPYTKTMRCRPTAQYIDQAYADAACTQAIGVSLEPLGECLTPARYAVAIENARAVYHVLMGPTTGFTKTDTGCIPLVDPPGYRYFGIGRAISEDELARATLVHD